MEDGSTNNFHSQFRPIYIDVAMIWEVILDVEEFFLEGDGVCLFHNWLIYSSWHCFGEDGIMYYFGVDFDFIEEVLDS